MPSDVKPAGSCVQDMELEETTLDSEPAGEMDMTAGGRPAGPVSAAERVGAIDTLRGFALLGILAMNIVGFGSGGR